MCYVGRRLHDQEDVVTLFDGDVECWRLEDVVTQAAARARAIGRRQEGA